MWYARRGLPIHEIGTLGRWKSSAVFRYIEEALQDIPLNAGLTVSLASLQEGNGVPRTPCLGTPCPGTPAPSTWTQEVKMQEAIQPKPLGTPKIQTKAPGPDQCWAVSSGRHGRTSHRVRNLVGILPRRTSKFLWPQSSCRVPRSARNVKHHMRRATVSKEVSAWRSWYPSMTKLQQVM